MSSSLPYSLDFLDFLDFIWMSMETLVTNSGMVAPTKSIFTSYERSVLKMISKTHKYFKISENHLTIELSSRKN
jgi:hypothetical protein